MIIKTIKRKDPFARIDKGVLQDPRLTWKAKGILAYLLGQPENWEVKTMDLVNHSANGKEAIWSALRELKRFGYAGLSPFQDEKTGRMVGRGWTIYEIPKDRNTENPCHGKPVSRKTRVITKNDRDTTYHSSTKKDCGGKCPSTNGFFASNGEITPFLIKCSHHLENFVRTSRKINPRFNRQKWYNEFRLLLQSIDGDKNRLRRVLKTFIDTPHDETTPMVECAESFRRKFLRVEDWIHRTSDQRPPEEEVNGHRKGPIIVGRVYA